VVISMVDGSFSSLHSTARAWHIDAVRGRPPHQILTSSCGAVAGLGAVVVVNFGPFDARRRKIGFPGGTGVYPEPGRRRFAQQIFRPLKILRWVGRVPTETLAVQTINDAALAGRMSIFSVKSREIPAFLQLSLKMLK